MTAYEQQREENIARNNAFLLSSGILQAKDDLGAAKKAAPKAKKPKPPPLGPSRKSSRVPPMPVPLAPDPKPHHVPIVSSSSLLLSQVPPLLFSHSALVASQDCRRAARATLICNNL